MRAHLSCQWSYINGRGVNFCAFMNSSCMWKQVFLVLDVFIWSRADYVQIVTMATNIPMDRSVSLCKKCGSKHERPVGSKCERSKVTKDEKRDTSKETTVRKTPRGKSTDMSSHEKILETVMTTMTTFTDKLNSMEERLSGLTSRLDTPVAANKSVSRKSRSREKVKRIEISDDDGRYLSLRD